MIKYLLLPIIFITCGLKAQALDINNNIIYATVPDGIALKECEYGYGLFATKPFKAGEVIYKYHHALIGTEEKNFILKTDYRDFILCTSTHSVGIGNDKRALFTFDSFMNHSCEPNSRSFNDAEMIKRCEYWQIATKDISIGDEITCDYNLFDYDCTDKNICDCCCRTEACRKTIKGFKWLPLHEQIKLLPEVDAHIFNQFLQDHPNYIYIEDMKVPSTISIIKNGNDAKIVSNYAYSTGDVIYKNHTLTFKDHQSIIIKMNGKCSLMDNTRHTVKRNDSEREFYYFDSFMNHSCDPNTITFYLSSNYYQTIALRPIAPGEELTCDYAVFDTTPDGDGFKCECGAKNCRGWLY